MSAPEVTRVEVSPGETPEAAGVVRSQARLALDHEGEGDPSHGAWVLWVEDDGLESRVCATRWGVRDTERRVCVLARGARGGFALGDAVAMPGGEGAFCWRGDEGFAWMVCVDRDGRFRSQRFVAPCEGAPSLARIDGELLLVFTAPDGGVRATAAHSAGSPVERWRGPDGSHSPCAVAIRRRV